MYYGELIKRNVFDESNINAYSQQIVLIYDGYSLDDDKKLNYYNM